MSRYSTFSAESQRPTPKAAATVRITNSGNAHKLAVGHKPTAAMIASKTPNEIAKSTKPASVAENGMMSRGKYTLVISRSLATRLLLDAVSAKANNCHGTSAQQTNTGYGRPSDVRPPSRPKNILNTTIVETG